MIANDKVILLTDAEVGEDVAEGFVGGDFAGDFAEVEQYFAHVFAKHIRGDATWL